MRSVPFCLIAMWQKSDHDRTVEQGDLRVKDVEARLTAAEDALHKSETEVKNLIKEVKTAKRLERQVE